MHCRIRERPKHLSILMLAPREICMHMPWRFLTALRCPSVARPCLLAQARHASPEQTASLRSVRCADPGPLGEAPSCCAVLSISCVPDVHRRIDVSLLRGND